MSAIPVDEHFSRLIHLMEMEAEAEKQAALDAIQRNSPAAAEASGYTLVNLVIRDEEAGLGGRVLLTLGKRNQSLALPWTRLGSGTPVILSEEHQASAPGWRGVVSRSSRESIQVALADWPETESERPTFRLDRASDEISRQRIRQGLDKARSAANSRLAELRDVLLGWRKPAFSPLIPIKPIDKNLNDSQREAVVFALSAADVAIIHGPPGTGKTTTLVELIRQIVQSGGRVLAVAPSNIAVDNLLEKLIDAGEDALRLGHPARIAPALRQHSLDAQAENNPEIKVAHRLVREAYALRDQAGKYTRARPLPGARRALRQEAKQALADARRIEDMVVERLLNNARIICATLTGLDRHLLANQEFEWCIMDEASQASEPAAWLPLQFAQRVILAGDHFQLPPTVISTEAQAKGLGTSLQEHLIARQGSQIARRLKVQYRMHHDIMRFSAHEFYEDDLAASADASDHLLCDLPGISDEEMTRTAVEFIDTAGASYDEALDADGMSRLNQMEAQLVQAKLRSLLDAGIGATDIAVISPYSAQVRHLRELIGETGVEIDSVDGFQGREKEAIILSLVRSNRDGEIGFLEDVRRMNVAMTRARRKLVVIGDSATITSNAFYQRLVTYFEQIGAYHSVWEDNPG